MYAPLKRALVALSLLTLGLSLLSCGDDEPATEDSTDTGPVVTLDMEFDGSAGDTGTDGSADTSTDTGTDTQADTQTEAGSDAGEDAREEVEMASGPGRWDRARWGGATWGP